jgi:hypothetical protein
VPGEADPQEQQAFVEAYPAFRATLGEEEAIGFLDESGFEYNSRPASCLIRKGQDKELPSTGGHLRVNVVGCVVVDSLDVDVVYTTSTIDTDLVKAYLEHLDAHLPWKKLHLFLDRASFHKTLVNLPFEHLELHLLPAYSPNLNLMERIWKWGKAEVLDNCYHAQYPDFLEHFCTFFADLPTRTEELKTRVTEKFQIVKKKIS